MTTPPAARATGPMSAAYRMVTVAIVTLTTAIAFEGMAVTTAMPRAAEELGAVGSYGLAFSAMLTAMLLGNVLAGIWVDRSGPLAPLFTGLALFAAGAAVCASAPAWGALLAGRVVQGVGGGLIVVTEFAVVGRVYPSGLRPRVFTWLSAAWVLPSVLGAPIAGWLASTWSWRWVFWVVLLPTLAGALLVLSQRLAVGRPVDAVTEPGEAAEHARVARLGAVVAVCAGLVQLAIHERSPLVAVPTLLAVAGLVGLGAATPRLLPAGTLRLARGLPAVVASRALFNASFMATVTYVPLMLVQVWRLDLTAAGAAVAGAALGWSTGSWIQGRWSPVGPGRRARLVWIGATLLTTGTLSLTVAAWALAPVWAIAACIVVAGLGMGVGSTTLSVLLLDLAPPAEHGRASASLQLADVLGSVLGIAASTAVFGLTVDAGDVRVYVAIEAMLTLVAAGAVVTGLRCAPASTREHVAAGRA